MYGGHQPEGRGESGGELKNDFYFKDLFSVDKGRINAKNQPTYVIDDSTLCLLSDVSLTVLMVPRG
jgi:hypothetical protein